MHPATLETADLLAHVTERRTRRSGPGGQHRNKVQTAVVLVHQPTGISAAGSERRSQAENRAVALRRLRMKLAVEHRAPARPAGPSARWLTRVRGGKLVISAGHDDFPALVAEALDELQAARWHIAAAAGKLGVTTSQLTGLLRKAPAAWAVVQGQRLSGGLPALK